MGACAFVVLVVAGCGGGGDGDSGLSRAELVRRLNAICAESIGALRDLNQPTTLEGLAAFAGEARPIVDGLIEQVEELEPPSGLEDELAAIVRLHRDGRGLLEDLGDAAEDGDRARVDAVLRDLQDFERREDRTARSLGAEECASG